MDSLTHLKVDAGCPLGHHGSPLMDFHPLVGYPGFPHILVVSEFQEGKPQGISTYQVSDPLSPSTHVPLTE